MSTVTHTLQQQILQLSKKRDIGGMSYRGLAKLLGDVHPYQVQHHLQQLQKKGLIHIDPVRKSIRSVKASESNGFLTIPIVGSANCGPAILFADQNIEGYLKVSSKLLSTRVRKGLFSLKAVGDSMNQAKIAGSKTIENGDYIIVDSEKKQPENDDYVVSVIDDVCNIKKFNEDKTNKQIVLLSESSHNYSPIYIHPEEANYLVCGTVVDVIKNQRDE